MGAQVASPSDVLEHNLEHSLKLSDGLFFMPTDVTLPWETLSAMIQGKSAIDLSAMPVNSREEAQSFLTHYGFDLDDPDDADEMEGYFLEAIDFIEGRFLTKAVDWEVEGEVAPPSAKIPDAIKQASPRKSHSVLDLIILASQKDNPLRPWACAILKVMHTLVYIQNSPLYKYHPQASKRILAKFNDIMAPNADGSWTMRGQNGRPLHLAKFEKKPYKPRESILIKLLCKKENVAENVWDLVGVRLVTFHPGEAILAVDILREQKILLFPNIIPSRCRNTLIDLPHFQELYQERLHEFQKGHCSLQEMTAIFKTSEFMLPDEVHADTNPMSSPKYRSLHITCRQLLRLRHEHSLEETRFAFPYEIQILDLQSYHDNLEGHGAHVNYKQRQLFTARRRVLGSLLQKA